MKFTKNEIMLMIYLVLQLASVFFKLSDEYTGSLDTILGKLQNAIQDGDKNV